ncbi:MAG: lamin tail domain-containing protein [Methylocystaceae bacterium]
MASKVRIRTVVDSAGVRAKNAKPDDEFVLIINEGDAPAFMGGWILLKKKPDSSHHEHYYFPETVEDDPLVLKPGQEMLVMTGDGLDTFIPPDAHGRGQWLLYQNRNYTIWNDKTDKLVLYAAIREEEKELFIKIDEKAINS